MKNSIIFLGLLMFINLLHAQSEITPKKCLITDRIVLEAAALPISLGTKADNSMTGFLFALGYKVNPKLDFRLHYDHYQFRYAGNQSFDEFNLRLFGLSLEGYYQAFQCKRSETELFNGLGFAGRFGFTATFDEKEQQTLFMDLSARLKLGDYSFISCGFNQHFGSLIPSSIEDENPGFLYLGFGINL
jgi:hypothetical protein